MKELFIANNHRFEEEYHNWPLRALRKRARNAMTCRVEAARQHAVKALF
jgi:hypothetical protein